jgi:transcriptional regulator with XRE-family HTH domain
MLEIMKNIEAIRKQKSVKQTVIANQMGVKQNAYSQYINRSTDIPYTRLSQIADILEVDVIDIIKYPDKYVQETDRCSSCLEKDKIIKQLSSYIEILEKKCK